MAFVEWLPKNIKKFANAKPEEIVAYLTKLSETPEGKTEFNALVTEYKKSKQNIPMAQKGAKIDYFVKKFENGDKIPTHYKWLYTPWEFSFIAADAMDLPKRRYNHDPREYKRVVSPTGEIRDRVIKKNGYGQTERRISPTQDTVYIYNGNTYYPEDEMYDRYEKAWRQYGVYKTGGKLDFITKFQHGGINVGEIRQDNRNEIEKWWDNIKFKYTTSHWNTSAINEVLTYATPWGIVDSILEGDTKSGVQEALISILPIGVTIDKLADAVKAASKSNPLKFIEIKGYENFPIGNGRIVSKKKGVLNEDKVQQLYNNNSTIRTFVDKGYNVTKDGKVIMPNGRHYDPDFNYVSNARDIERAIRQQSPQRYGESLDVSSGVDRGSNYRGYTYGGSKVKHTW